MTRLTLILLPVAISLAIASCQQADPDSGSAPKEVPAEAETGGVGGDAEFVGLTLEEAEALAEKRELPHRVVMVDGEPRPATKDYRPNRLNFELESGKVVKVTRG